MKSEERIKCLTFLGERLRYELDHELNHDIIEQAYLENNWFSHEFIRLSLNHIIDYYLNEKKLKQWLSNYTIPEHPTSKKTALILAGNIPLVGFHDVVCNFLAGHHSMIRLSHKDKVLLPYAIKLMSSFHPDVHTYFSFEEKLTDFDAVIATGSDTSARYFEYYFGKYPRIIRKNRNSAAILTGNEKETELSALAKDIFYYYGLGCRSISKIFVPENYNLKPFFTACEQFAYFDNFFRYANNYQYNKSIYLVNQIPHYDNGFLLLKEDEGFHPPIAVLYYEVYKDIQAVIKKLKANEDKLQIVVSQVNTGLSQVNFGQTQFPELWDYADNVDTLKFLLSI